MFHQKEYYCGFIHAVLFHVAYTLIFLMWPKYKPHADPH